MLINFITLAAIDHSRWWALWQMRNGNAVCHTKASRIKYSMPTHYVKRRVRENCTDDMSIEVWLSGADEFGWQIYEEKPEPFAVGDWVEYNHAGKKHIGKVQRVSTDMVDLYMFNQSKAPFWCYMGECKKFSSPFEVIVHIGCLEGTVEHSSLSHFCLCAEDNWTMIAFDMLDTPTRELVESLLRA